MMTRAEHLQWCKTRAMQYVRMGDYEGAVSSMLSDLRKHEETRNAATGVCAQLGMMELLRGPTREGMARYIDGFN